ncbi:mitogen-activated protein kinase kinase kinase 1-like [Rosa rugosa]|uniref:mitogen-activated protein kinase kinase kinase 1-like n=1 Tax=Rosa rugosa TaxID=74645 RepID=UPI002B40904C|nr:mitogen-activated protein kinase kinase kinase 1-like [Rosa rugosa]
MNEIQSLQGTAFWMAPEVFSAKMKNQGYGPPADIWSLGCTVLEMLTRQVPYPGLEPFQAFFKIAMGELPHVPHFLCKEARDSSISVYKLIQRIDTLLLSSYVIHLSRWAYQTTPCVRWSLYDEGKRTVCKRIL